MSEAATGLCSPEALVLWVDDEILVAQKPAGLSTLVDGFNPGAPFLLGLLGRLYSPLWVVHRLDKWTSGVIVFARTAQSHRALNMQFERHTTQKIYHALVHGAPKWEQQRVSLPLRPDGDRRHRTVVDPLHGKPAQTDLLALERLPDFTLVQAAPRTGRTHQIRCHLAELGHPIAGDTLYGGKPLPELGRFGLHAFSLQFDHPRSGERVAFQAAYPEDLEAAIGALRSRRATQPG